MPHHDAFHAALELLKKAPLHTYKPEGPALETTLKKALKVSDHIGDADVPQVTPLQKKAPREI